MTDYKLNYGKIATKIQSLSNSAITEIYSEFSRDIPKFIRYLKKENVTKVCCEIKALRASALLGEYSHPNTEIETFVRANLKKLNLTKIIGQLSSAMPLGFAVAEVEFGLEHNNNKKQTVIKGIDVLDHTRVGFRGNKGNIHQVTYNDITKKYIPYDKVIHLTNGIVTDFDEAFGTPEMYSALPYIISKLSILEQMVKAGENNATGIWIGKTQDKTISLYDKSGKAIDGQKRSVQYLAEQLATLKNNSYLALDSSYEVTPTQIGDGSQFWIPVLTYLDKSIRLCFAVPDLVYSEGTNALSKTSTLAGKHISIMDTNIKYMVDNIKTELINKAIKCVVWANFGFQSDWGDFKIDRTLDDTQEQTQVQNLMSSISYGILDANDPEVQNAIRKSLGLSTKSKDEIIKAQEEKAQLQSQLQMMQMQGQDPNQQQQQYP
jgi:hypothetical protein